MNPAAAAYREGDTVLSAQVASLLQRVEMHCDQRCREILDQAELQARQIEHDAWHEAGARGRAAIAEARGLLEADQHRTQALVDAALRQLAQSQARARLDELWRRLPEALETAWQSPRQRATWLRIAIAVAARTLLGKCWTIEHGVNQGAAEIEGTMAGLGFGDAFDLSLTTRPEITAGVRIRCEGACVDATAAGLLADVGAIEAAFLAECEASGAPDACGILPDAASG